MTIDQGMAHGEVLRHPNQRVVHCRIAVGMVLTEHFTHYAGALAKGPISGES